VPTGVVVVISWQTWKSKADKAPTKPQAKEEDDPPIWGARRYSTYLGRDCCSPSSQRQRRLLRMRGGGGEGVQASTWTTTMNPLTSRRTWLWEWQTSTGRSPPFGKQAHPVNN
jgi:hypothetical protein